MEPAELARIGKTLYAGVAYHGAEAWGGWLCEGIGIRPRTLRSWLSDRSGVPGHVAILLRAAAPLSKRLDLPRQPRGTAIAQRLADLAADAIAAAGRAEASQNRGTEHGD